MALALAGCAVGDGSDAYYNLSLGGDAGESGELPASSSTTGSDESTGDADATATKTGPWPPTTTEGDSTGGSTDATKGEPGDESSTGELDPSTDTGPPPPPPGDPMYTPCEADSDCVDGICLRVEDQNEQLLSKYCTASCASPALDCDDPIGATADPVCLPTNQGGAVCALSCVDGQSCPSGLSCWEQTYCF